jgi:hypothetical protein
MSSIVINGDTSGSVTLSAPAVSGSSVLTLPAVTDTLAGIAATQTLTNKTLTSPVLTTPALGTPSALVLTNATGLPQAGLGTNVAGNGPAFSAYAGSATSLSGGAFTKVLFDTEEFDTNSNFASSRFTPTVAGYYQINGAVSVATGAQLVVSIYKNGAEFKRGSNIRASSDGSVSSSIIYCNGSTDYVEIYCFATSTINTSSSASLVWFNGAMIRAA